MDDQGADDEANACAPLAAVSADDHVAAVHGADLERRRFVPGDDGSRRRGTDRQRPVTMQHGHGRVLQGAADRAPNAPQCALPLAAEAKRVRATCNFLRRYGGLDFRVADSIGVTGSPVQRNARKNGKAHFLPPTSQLLSCEPGWQVHTKRPVSACPGCRRSRARCGDECAEWRGCRQQGDFTHVLPMGDFFGGKGRSRLRCRGYRANQKGRENA